MFASRNRIVSTLKLPIPFPDAILLKSTKTISGSVHASTIISVADEDVRETLRIWFAQALAPITHFELDKPPDNEDQATASRMFTDYFPSIEALGLRAWDIQNLTSVSSYIILEDSNKIQKKLIGRADFIISTADASCIGAAPHHAVCVIEKQSRSDEECCEYQLVTYLVIMMNSYGLNKLSGILLYEDGRCRAYRASRSAEGGTIFEGNDTFQLYQIPDVLPILLAM